MEDRIIESFEGIELEKRKEINSLMEDWRDEVAPNMIIFKDDEIEYSGDKYFAADGFFPGYYKQKNKLLFIGRETRWMGGGDNIAQTIEYFKNSDDQNQNAFTRHTLYIVQGIKHEGKIKYENLEYANDYAKEMAEENDYGFAVINISKYSNDSETGATADIELIHRFLADSNLEKRNYFHEELAILQPDIIITGNLLEWEIDKNYIKQCFGVPKRIKSNETAVLYEMELNGKKIKLIDMYHFSSRIGTDKDCYYDPIMELLFG